MIPGSPKAIGFLIPLALLALTSVTSGSEDSETEVRRICPPLAKVADSASYSAAVNILLKCETGPLSEDQALGTLRDSLLEQMPQLFYREDTETDLHVILTLTDYVPEHFDCDSPRWYWTAVVLTWIPVPDEPGMVTFVALVELTGSTSAGSEAYARGFAEGLAKIAADPGAVPPSSSRCGSDAWFPEEPKSWPRSN